MTTRPAEDKWLHPKRTSVKDAWVITISGFDCTDRNAPEASFLWPREIQCSIPSEMVLMSQEMFRELCRMAGHGTGTIISAPSPDKAEG